LGRQGGIPNRSTIKSPNEALCNTSDHSIALGTEGHRRI